MTSVSKLLFGAAEPADRLRYASGIHRRPVVVWNCTRRCNLSCSHCYAAGEAGGPELDGAEARALIDDLAAFGVPALLFSGGEPFARPDLRALCEHARECGLKVTFSTNGTLIDDSAADWLGAFGAGYVGISIDGSESVHDRFRRSPGAHRAALAAVRRLVARGVKVGLRVTMTRDNVRCIPDIFALMRRENVRRICLYHLVYTGRGREIAASDLSAAERRAALDSIAAETRAAFAAGFPVEALTVDNHADGPYYYLRELERERRGEPGRSAQMLELLALNGGNSSGEGIACVSWDGTVYPDQFWRNRPVGSVRERPFSEIWSNPPEGSLLADLRRRRELVKGRCRGCRWLAVCGGNFRARGEAATGDVWGEDPSCMLTDVEIRELRQNQQGESEK